MAARLDCNRGRGTWRSPGPNRLELGPLALTRAMCPPGSLHDRLVAHWSAVRSYVLDHQLLVAASATPVAAHAAAIVEFHESHAAAIVEFHESPAAIVEFMNRR